MNQIKKRFANLYFGYLMLVFSLAYILFSPIYLLVTHYGNPHARIIYWMSMYISRLVFLCAGVTIKVKGKQYIDKNKSYLFCPNHKSYMDIPILSSALPHLLVFVGKDSINKVPLFGPMFKKVHIPIDRSSLRSRQKSLLQSKQVLAKGTSVCLFPEGTIPKVKDARLIPFMDGPFWLAIKTKTPLVPVSMPQNWKFLYSIEKEVYWQRIHVVIHKPIDTKNMTKEDIPALKQQVYDTIRHEVYAQNQIEELRQ